MTERDANRVLALLAAVAMLAAPRRTRPLSGFMYGVFLSRAAGASRVRIESTILMLFNQRNSVMDRVKTLEEWVDALHGAVVAVPDTKLTALDRRLDRLETAVKGLE